METNTFSGSKTKHTKDYYRKTIGKSVCLGWLGNNRIRNNVVQPIIQNVTEFHIGVAYESGLVNQVYGNNIEELCELAKDYDHLLIVRVGMAEFSFIENFLDWLINNKPSENIIGHILDKKDSYYELHPQLLYIKPKWWDSLEDKTVGKESNESWITKEPIRSNHNFHGTYTPKWVKNGTEEKTYKNKRFGWNIIKQALESKNGVGIWGEEERQSYDYIYPETPDWKDKFFFWLDQKWDMTYKSYYVANTEKINLFTYANEENSVPTPDRLQEEYIFITTGGGLLSAFTVYNAIGWHAKYIKTHVSIVDVSQHCLECQRKIHTEWNATTSWKDYIESNIIDQGGSILGAHKLDQMNTFIENNPDFQKWFNEVYTKTCTISFENEDLLSENSIKNIVKKYATNDIENKSHKDIRIFFKPTNIYAYLGTSLFLSWKERLHANQETIKYFKDIQERYPNISVQLFNKLYMLTDLDNVLQMLPWFKK